MARGTESPAPPVPGIVVEEVARGMAGEEAGLRPGDVLLSWRREMGSKARRLPAGGALGLPFDLTEVLLEQVPRGRVTLTGRRGSVAMSWALPRGAPSDPQAVRTIPALSGDLLAGYRQGSWRSASATAQNAGASGLAVWFLAEGARAAARQERWSEADLFYDQALSPRAGAAPASFVAAQLFREWGDLFQRRRDWGRAEECFERALAADRRKPFASLAAAWSLTGLGYTDNLSGGPKEDDGFFRRALEIRSRLAPGSADDAASWFHWGNAAVLDGEVPAAIERYERAVRRLEQLDTGRLLLVEVLFALAQAHLRQDEMGAAEKVGARAYALVRQEAPDHFLVAGITQGLGVTAARRGDLRRAEELLSLSLAVFRRHQPESLAEADALHELGLVQRQARKPAAAERQLCRAVDLVEAWRKRFQHLDETRYRWGVVYAGFYRDCAEALVETGQAEAAFLAVEKGRARALLDLRAERGFRLGDPSPRRTPEWQELNAEYDRVQEELDGTLAREERDFEAIVNLEGRLREVRRSKERILARHRPPGPIRYPDPVSLPEARRRLEPGTALLFYSVGESRTLLFVLSEAAGPSGWTILTLDQGASELRKRVRFFRDALIRDRSNRRGLPAQARALYELLVRPAEPYLARSDRVVISPDGPLHTLPFAALLRGERHLVEWKPLHFVLSATVYADLLAQRPRQAASRPRALVAFGDPRAPTPLPATRQEVRGIATRFSGARVYLGDEVTEERVKEAVRGVSHIHFAVHGLLDERNPLNSALILSPGGEGESGSNGRLQAWEVMEGLPLDADLVTLSACDTALGRESDGEGLIGLTRAFQYAGARSVIATLWGISDRSTAGFMAHLYGALRAGKTKDEALRAAQIAQLRSDRPQPFYWAPFQLFGDWQ